MLSQQPSFEAWAEGASIICVGLCPEFDALEERELVKSHWPNPKVPSLFTALASGVFSSAPCSLHHKGTVRKEPLSPLQGHQALLKVISISLRGHCWRPQSCWDGGFPTQVTHCQAHGMGMSPPLPKSSCLASPAQTPGQQWQLSPHPVFQILLDCLAPASKPHRDSTGSGTQGQPVPKAITPWPCRVARQEYRKDGMTGCREAVY